MSEIDHRPSDAQLDKEFAYTPHDDSCKNLLDIVQYCRRRLGHDGEHASGFGSGRRRWTE